jgi:hypothetical protein
LARSPEFAVVVHACGRADGVGVHVVLLDRSIRTQDPAGDVMTAPVVETWRVADRVRHTPAHLITYDHRGVLITACHWTPRRAGQLLDRAEMLSLDALVCRKCALKAVTR